MHFYAAGVFEGLGRTITFKDISGRAVADGLTSAACGSPGEPPRTMADLHREGSSTGCRTT